MVSDVTVEELCTYLKYKGEIQEEQAFLTGVKELAAFLHMSVSNAERKICNHDFDYCLYRTGHVLLFDKNKLLEGMKVTNKKRDSY